jgi:isopentenyl-diphosphate Delta-isomerase
MQLIRRPPHRNRRRTASGYRLRFDNDADHVIAVDANDAPIGTLPKLEAHQRGVRHRAISVFVGDRHGRLLLHKRAAGKYHSGGLWTNTCCSHPRPGESAIDAAIRRLAEEMGISCSLAFIFSMNYRADVSNDLVEDEIVHVFGGHFDGTPSPDPLEASDWCWKSAAEIAQDVDEHPENYTIWFQIYRRDFWSDIVRLTETNFSESLDIGTQPAHDRSTSRQ